MNLEEIQQVVNIVTKQRKMGKHLLKEIKKDPPKDGKRSFGSLSDAITLKYLNLINEKKDIKTEGILQESAYNYAKSIMEAKQLMTDLVSKQKTEKEKEMLVGEWDDIEMRVSQEKQRKQKKQKKEPHWSDIIKK